MGNNVRYFSVSVEDTLGKGITELDSEDHFQGVEDITVQMNENLNVVFQFQPIQQQLGQIQFVIKSGQGYKAIILYRGDFTSKKRREGQRMIQDVLEGKTEPKRADDVQPSPEPSAAPDDEIDRPVYEIKFGIVFADIVAKQGLKLDAAFKIVPYETMEAGELKSCIDDGILAEFDVPYHPPIEEDQRIYALNFHVAGLANDEPALGYASRLQPYARQIYLDFKHLAKPLNPWGEADED